MIARSINHLIDSLTPPVYDAKASAYFYIFL
jgi:hypothetical protein